MEAHRCCRSLDRPQLQIAVKEILHCLFGTAFRGMAVVCLVVESSKIMFFPEQGNMI